MRGIRYGRTATPSFPFACGVATSKSLSNSKEDEAKVVRVFLTACRKGPSSAMKDMAQLLKTIMAQKDLASS